MFRKLAQRPLPGPIDGFIDRAADDEAPFDQNSFTRRAAATLVLPATSCRSSKA